MLLGAALLLALQAPQGARGQDVYFEQTTFLYVDGQAQGPGILSRVWFAGRKLRLETGVGRGPALILRLDKDLAYRLDPAGKVSVVSSLDSLRAQSQLDLSTAGDLIGGVEEGSARAHLLPGTKVVAGETCQGYRIRSRTAVMDVFLAPIPGLGMDAFAEFLEWSGANQSMGGLMAALKGLPGFPMETRSHVKVLGHDQDAISTLSLLRRGPIDPALFESPRDYTVVHEGESP
jgi:hypothetical protein